MTVKELLDREAFSDSAILKHGFTDYMRDYEIIVGARDGPPKTDMHRYQFVGCVEAITTSRVAPKFFVKSLSDQFVNAGPDYPNVKEPDGFIWGVRYSNAYPGLTYLPDGERSAFWTTTLGRQMHEVTIETEAFHLRLVFADVRHEFAGHDKKVLIPRKDYPISINPANRTADGCVG